MADKPTVAWTEKHLEELERVYPELVDETDTNKLLLNCGKRSVVEYVRNQVRKKRYLHE